MRLSALHRDELRFKPTGSDSRQFEVHEALRKNLIDEIQQHRE
jgi:hypothetical protein